MSEDRPQPTHLLALGATEKDLPEWIHGRALPVPWELPTVDSAIEDALRDGADGYLLLWDAKLGAPPHPSGLMTAGVDVVHAGLRLGLRGLPTSIDHVDPTWMLNLDPPEDVDASSWRLSLRACLARVSSLRRVGGLDLSFGSIDAAGLDLGMRLLRAGAVMRHSGSGLVNEREPTRSLPRVDEYRCISKWYGRKWLLWARWRRIYAGAWRRRDAETNAPRASSRSHDAGGSPDGGVSVVIPTLGRYGYLERVLEDLSAQTMPPDEVVVVDQTPPQDRELVEHAGLPLTVVPLEIIGQSSARNEALERTTGRYVLFVDDDDELPPGLIETHLALLEEKNADASAGIAEETGLPTPDIRSGIADVFPTNNSVVSRRALDHAGWFDLAFDHGARADLDLGIRMYLTGSLILNNPGARVLHHRAPSGGLREHGARRVTYGAGRSQIRTRHLLSPTEAYLWMRYFTPRQVREAIAVRVAGTFSIRGPLWRRAVRAVVALLLLPSTIVHSRRTLEQARSLLQSYPRLRDHRDGR